MSEVIRVCSASTNWQRARDGKMADASIKLVLPDSVRGSNSPPDGHKPRNGSSNGQHPRKPKW